MEQTHRTILLETATSRLRLDAESGRLVSFRTREAPRQEFLAATPDHPVFVIQYLDARGGYHRLTSHDARQCSVSVRDDRSQRRVSIDFRRIGGLDMDVQATVCSSGEDPYSRWRIRVSNRAGLRIVDVQYPYVVCRYQLRGKAGSERVLLPNTLGQLIHAPSPEKLGPDSAAAWEFNTATGWFWHYPGMLFAQFLAYFNDRGGIYLACEDTEANVKRFRVLHREPGLRLGVAHIGDWPEQGERELGYDVVLGGFTGDWYDAAMMYRDWTFRQDWAVPLSRRSDVPNWLLESPPHITIRPQGIVDAGPVMPVKPFLPYEKCVPLLSRIARRVESPLVAVVMGWERAGSWVYPDCFPPIGGEESLTRFARQCRQRGWHVGSFCNGTRWVIRHLWNDYDGRADLVQRRGEKSLCRLPDGNPWPESWDVSWRPSYLQCLGTKMTRSIAGSFVRRLIHWGLESIQFFDQNCGAVTFPCFAADHEHPPVPGKWMARKMAQTVAMFRRAASSAGEPGVILSAETCVNETCLPLFQQTDSRLRPPEAGNSWGASTVPLYQFLFHECIIIHGMMSTGPEPYHVETTNAYNGVMGEIPGGVLTGDGTLLDKDTFNWAPWKPRVGHRINGLEMIRTVTATRRGPGRDFLVFGRMQRPCLTRNVRKIRWVHGTTKRALDAVFHACWTAPDGRYAIVLANWTTQRQPVTVDDANLGGRAVVHIVSRRSVRAERAVRKHRVRVTLPPLSCAVVEAAPVR